MTRTTSQAAAQQGATLHRALSDRSRVRILDYITPDFVHVFVDGRIVEGGGPELAHKLEAEGYERYGVAAV